jgi:hypothetical protein
MHTLHDLMRETKKLAGMGGYDFTEEAYGPDSEALLAGAALWRLVIKEGDDILEAVQKVVENLETIEGDAPPQRRNAALVDVRRATQEVQATTKSVYGNFAQGREKLYEAAKIWGMSTRRSGKGTKKTADITKVSDEALVAQAAQGSKNLVSATARMLETGATACQKMVITGKAGCPEAMREPTLTAGLDFRDTVSEALFGRVNGVMRRAVAVIDRFAATQESRLLESKDSWVAPWAKDKEIGDGELI